MEEIALVFSSLAGACTAVAMDKIPKRKPRQAATVSSAMESQLHSLRIEKDILTKTITRLHKDGSGIQGVQRDKLLIRYQHQIGVISAKIEKLEAASRYPDLGPVGDTIISLMDSRLSKLDERLHEISSKITVNSAQPAGQAAQQQAKVTAPRQELRQQQAEQQLEPVFEAPKAEVPEPGSVAEQQRIEIPRPQVAEAAIPAEIEHPRERISVELSTLTRISGRRPEFPAEFMKPQQPEPRETIKNMEEYMVPEAIVPVEPEPLVTREVPLPEAPRAEPVVEKVDVPAPVVEKGIEMAGPAVEKKIEMPAPIRIPEEDDRLEDDDKDLDKIKSEIMRALSKLEQVEVE
ncbi:MAG: hypothetical protein KGI33_10570 [Thaumarchaeota archaeon]|nr:hypothetical protein [Nitrososphaerota archaeon]